MPTTPANRTRAAGSASSGEGEQGGKIKPRLWPSSVKTGQSRPQGALDHASPERAPRQGDGYGYGLAGPSPALASLSGSLNRSVLLSEKIHRRTGRQNERAPRRCFVQPPPLSQTGGHHEARRTETLHRDGRCARAQPAASSNDRLRRLFADQSTPTPASDGLPVPIPSSPRTKIMHPGQRTPSKRRTPNFGGKTPQSAHLHYIKDKLV